MQLLGRIQAHLSPAYAAALALIVIQAGIGVLYKFAQHGGGYAFSPSSSITISEFLKFLLSTFFFYRECSKRQENASSRHSSWELGSRQSSDEKGLLEDSADLEDAANSSEQRLPSRTGESQMRLATFLRYCLNEVSAETQLGFAQLALLYALINNTVFVLYRLADPGTIQLIKSGITLITALVLWFNLGTKIVKLQWIAILLQISGLVITQYNPATGSSYPLTTYLVLMFQTFLSAVAGVYNQKLCKSENASLHADNMVLYAAGVCVNLLVHVMTRFIKADEPGFFTGYGDWGALMVIMSNVFIGLAITAVYKYADAVIKCFATAISTAILLYISPIFFGVDMSILVIPGTTVVFLATWLYMEGTPPKDPSAPPPQPPLRSFGLLSKLWKSLSILLPQNRPALLGIRTAMILFVIGSLTTWDMRKSAKPVEQEGPEIQEELTAHIGKNETIRSPFENSVAYVRWNDAKYSNRIPYARAYDPFFHTVHLSIPKSTPGHGTEVFTNVTHDSWDKADTDYQGVAETMRTILDESKNITPRSNSNSSESRIHTRPASEIDGLLFFHFDAWVDPLGFANEDPSKIWFPARHNQEPLFQCINDTGTYPWFHWSTGEDKKALSAIKSLENLNLGYTVPPYQRFCTGWTDIFFIPRSYFHDFVILSTIFSAHDVFLEVAIPTIVNIIDLTRRSHPSRSVIKRLGDCWGDCCVNVANPEDILWNRCGHRLDHTKTELVNTQLTRLREEEAMLGTMI